MHDSYFIRSLSNLKNFEGNKFSPFVQRNSPDPKSGEIGGIVMQFKGKKTPRDVNPHVIELKYFWVYCHKRLKAYIMFM
jgi:hypothetical protein